MNCCERLLAFGMLDVIFCYTRARVHVITTGTGIFCIIRLLPLDRLVARTVQLGRQGQISIAAVCIFESPLCVFFSPFFSSLVSN